MPHSLLDVVSRVTGGHLGWAPRKSTWWRGLGEEVGFPPGNQGQVTSRNPGGASKAYVRWGQLSPWDMVGRGCQRNWDSRQGWKRMTSCCHYPCFAWPHYVNSTLFVLLVITNLEIFEAYRIVHKMLYQTPITLQQYFLFKMFWITYIYFLDHVYIFLENKNCHRKN